MKSFAAILSLFTILNSYSIDLVDGLYECVDGGIYCPQKIKKIYFGETTIGLSVEYVGDCEGQGKLIFSCDGNYCFATTQQISIIKSESYWWKHDIYDFACQFNLRPDYSID